MDVVSLHSLTISPADLPLGTDADAWFMALDGRVARVGSHTGILRIEGIHGQGFTLWMQVALFGDTVPGVVLQVQGHHSAHDVLETLRRYEPTGVPLEIIEIQSALR